MDILGLLEQALLFFPKWRQSFRETMSYPKLYQHYDMKSADIPEKRV